MKLRVRFDGKTEKINIPQSNLASCALAVKNTFALNDSSRIGLSLNGKDVVVWYNDADSVNHELLDVGFSNGDLVHVVVVSKESPLSPSLTEIESSKPAEGTEADSVARHISGIGTVDRDHEVPLSDFFNMLFQRSSNDSDDNMSSNTLASTALEYLSTLSALRDNLDNITGDGKPASRAALEGLVDYVVTAADEAAGRDCGICLDEFNVRSPCKEMPCHHVFHDGCLFEWLKTHNSCPACRIEIQSSNDLYEESKRSVNDNFTRHPNEMSAYV